MVSERFNEYSSSRTPPLSANRVHPSVRFDSVLSIPVDVCGQCNDDSYNGKLTREQMKIISRLFEPPRCAHQFYSG